MTSVHGPAAGATPAAAPDRQPLLEVSGVVRHFGRDVAVDRVDLTVRPGEIHALIGLNGAGKTTLMRLALGMLRADRGSAHLRLGAGQAVDVQHAPPTSWAAVGHLIETPFAYAELTVAEVIHAAARLRGLRPADAGTATTRVIDELVLGRWARRRTRELSLGNRQRVGLACALVHRPRLLVLDEPANGLDPAGVVAVRALLLAATARGGGILVSSHHLDEVARMATRITVMHQGRVLGALPPGGADLERQFFAMVYAAEGLTASAAQRSAPGP